MSGEGSKVKLELAPTPATAEDLVWQHQAEQARTLGLTTIQISAERWGSTLLAVTGLLTTVGAFLGASKVSELEDSWARAWAGVLLGAALLIAGASVVLAARAAQGQVVHIVPTGPELKKATLKQAEVAHSRLLWSRRVSLLILPVFLSALAIVTYAPQEGSTQWFLVTRMDGRQICASEIAVVGRSTTVQDKNKHTHRLSVSDISTVLPVDKC